MIYYFKAGRPAFTVVQAAEAMSALQDCAATELVRFIFFRHSLFNFSLYALLELHALSWIVTALFKSLSLQDKKDWNKSDWADESDWAGRVRLGVTSKTGRDE
jgi:hypothetical protein